MQRGLVLFIFIFLVGWLVGPSGEDPPLPQSFDWYAVPSSTTADLFDIDMTGPDNGWIATGNGSLLHWDGHQWQPVVGLPGVKLTAISVISETLGWAVGDTMLSWDGSLWSPYDYPLNKYLSDVQMLSSHQAWAVGYAGRILRWDGSNWSTRLSTHGEWIRGVDGLADDDMWAVYGTSDSQDLYGGIIHWDGLLWSDVLTHTTSLRAIDMLSTTQGWAVGFNRQIYAWDGMSWSVAPSQIPSSGGTLWAVSAISAEDAWAAGADGLLAHWDGVSWEVAPGPPEAGLGKIQFYGIKMLAPDDVWVVGSQGKIYHYRPLRAFLPLITSEGD
jgi:hypothetical protein